MSMELLQQLAFALSVVAVLLCGAFGGRPERVGAAIVVVATGVTWIAQFSFDRTPELAFLLIDLATGLAFAVLLFRTRLLWPGVAACAQLLLTAFNATRFLDFPLSESSYIMVLQLSGVILSAALLYGVWERRFPRRQEAW